MNQEQRQQALAEAERQLARIHPGADVFRVLTALCDEVRRLDMGLRCVRHEVTGKKGGPERDDCVSVPFLHQLVHKVLDGVPRTEWQC